MRTAVNGWYLVVMGLVACVAAATWNFSLSDKEVMRLVLDALLWLQRELLNDVVGYLFRTLPSAMSPLAAVFDWLKDLFKQTFINNEIRLVPFFLLLTYFVISRPAAFIVRLIFEILSRALLRYGAKSTQFDLAEKESSVNGSGWRNRLLFWRRRDPSKPMVTADALRGLNASLGVSAGSYVLRPLLFAVLLFLFASFCLGHRLGPPAGSASFDWWDPFAAHSQVFWLGLYVFAAELLGQLLRLGGPRLFQRTALKMNRPPSVVAPDLVPLYLRGLRDHGAHILAKRMGNREARSASTIRQSVAKTGFEQGKKEPFALKNIAQILQADANFTDASLTSRLKDIEQFLRTPGYQAWQPAPRYMILHEALHPLHLKIIFALCADQQSRGRVSLIICPENIVRDVDTALKQCASSSLASLVQRGFVLGRNQGQLGAEKSYSYIIVADTDVERELLSAGSSVQFVLENLGMIVALEAQDLQVSLLRLRLPRLWLRVPRDEIKILVQVGSLANYRSVAQALFPRDSNETVLPPINWPTKFGDTSVTHTIVWRGGEKTADSVLEKYLVPKSAPTYSTGLALVAYAMTGPEKERAFRKNSSSINQSEVNDAAFRLANARIDGTDQIFGDALQPASQGSENARKASRVIIVEERTNILTALTQFHDWYRHGEILLNIVVHDYPLANSTSTNGEMHSTRFPRVTRRWRPTPKVGYGNCFPRSMMPCANGAATVRRTQGCGAA